MSFDHNCRFQFSQCNIREITESPLNMVSLVAKIEYVIINSNWMQEIMAGQKKKLRYSEETP